MSGQHYDAEKNQARASGDCSNKHGSYQEPNGIVLGENLTYGDGFYAKVQRIGVNFKIELRGIERVPEDERTDNGFRANLNVATMVRWMPWKN